MDDATLKITPGKGNFKTMYRTTVSVLLSPLSRMASIFDIPATAKTPAVHLSHEEGVLRITGCSIPENADRFYAPVYDEVDRYALAPRPRTSVHMELSYFNSSTSKYVLDLLKRLEDLHATGLSQVVLDWYYQEGDLDMREAGEDYRSLVEFPVKLKELPG